MQRARIDRGQPLEQRDDALAQLERVAIEKRERAPHAALRERRGGRDVGIVGASPDRGRRGACEVAGGERPQREQPATGTDGRQNAGGGVAHQQQQGAPRRFLQDLEQRVGALAVQFVDRIDDGHPPSPLPGRRAEERHRPSHIIDLDVLAQLAGLFVDGAFQHKEVALRLRRDAPCHRMIGIDLQRGRIPHRRDARGSGWASTKRAMR